jgi:hypothetical protein
MLSSSLCITGLTSLAQVKPDDGKGSVPGKPPEPPKSGDPAKPGEPLVLKDPFPDGFAGLLKPGDAPPPNPISVISTKMTNAGAVLEWVTIVTIGGKKFIQGSVPAGLGAPWTQKNPILIAVEDVTQIVIYANIVDVKAALNLTTKSCP